MNFLHLPECVMLEVFEYLTYDEVSKNRLVCQKFDQVSQQVLNSGFNKAVSKHSKIYKRIKALLPRRESERRTHALANHVEILTTIKTRISMLSFTYGKFMDLKLCCFIPGRVLDEIFSILNMVAVSQETVQRPYEVLQELRDISTMAMDHFSENISNALDSRSLSSIGIVDSGCISQSFESLRHRMPFTYMESPMNFFAQLNAGIRLPLSGMVKKREEPGGCSEVRAAMAKLIKLQEEFKNGVIRMNRMQQVQLNQARRLQQTEATINEMKIKMDEFKQKLEDLDDENRELSANMNQFNPGGEQVTPAIAPSPSRIVPTDHLPEDTNMNCDTDNSIRQISRKRKAESN